MRIAALLAGAILVSAGAIADSLDDRVVIHSTTVTFDRALASTPAGARDLYAALKLAASRVCVDTSDLLVVQGRLFTACRSAALGQAVSRIDIQALSELHRKDGRVRGRRVRSAGG